MSNKINIKKLKNDKNDHRSLWDVKQLKKWKASNNLFTKLRKNRTNAQFALNYCLSFSQICAAIPGMMQISEIKENIKVLNASKLNTNIKSKIKNINKNNEFIIKKRSHIY